MIGIGNPSPKISYVTLKRGLEMDTEEEEMTLLLYRSNEGSDHHPPAPTLKVQTLAGLCAFSASIVFSVNNLLIQAYNLHCTDLLILRNIIQVIIFGSLLKVQNITWWPSGELYPNVKDYIIEVIYVIMQVRFIFQWHNWLSINKISSVIIGCIQ
mgnify:CR=1 FL=1